MFTVGKLSEAVVGVALDSSPAVMHTHTHTHTKPWPSRCGSGKLLSKASMTYAVRRVIYIQIDGLIVHMGFRSYVIIAHKIKKIAF